MDDQDTDLNLENVDSKIKAKIYKSKMEKAQAIVEELKKKLTDIELRERDLVMENIDIKHRLDTLTPLFSAEKESKNPSASTIEKIKKRLKIAREEATFYSNQVDELKITIDEIKKEPKDREKELEREITHLEDRLKRLLDDLGEDDESHQLKVQLEDSRKVKDRLAEEKEKLSVKITELREKDQESTLTIERLRSQFEQSSRKGGGGGGKDGLFDWKGEEESGDVEEKLLPTDQGYKCTRLWNKISKRMHSFCSRK